MGQQGDLTVDVVVVGARVAGAILAADLGERGWHVLVIDRATFPSPTMSTHFFRGSGCAAALDRLGVLEEVLRLGAPPLVREYNADALTGDVTVDGPQAPGEIGFSLSVRRETLDAVLVERARREPTVAVREGTGLRTLRWEDGRVAGAIVGPPEEPMDVRARFVVGADGHASAVAKAVDAEVEETYAPCRAMYYRYAVGFEAPDGPPDAPEFSLADDELAYVFPSDGDRACIAISLNPDDYRIAHTSAEAFFVERLAAHPFLAPRTRRADWEGRLWGCGPRPAVVRVPVGDGWALVGDASMHQDPWTGEGMDHAATHAGFLAEALDDALSGHVPEAEALAIYHERRNEHALPEFRETGDLARDLNRLRD